MFLSHRRPVLSHTHWGRRNTIAVGWVFFILMWVRIAHGPVDTAALVEALTGKRIDTETAARDYARHFEDVFATRAEWGSPESLVGAAHS